MQAAVVPFTLTPMRPLSTLLQASFGQIRAAARQRNWGVGRFPRKGSDMPRANKQGMGEAMTYDRRRDGALRLMAVAGIVLVLAGCGFTGDQRDAVRQFGRASAEFGDATVGVVTHLPRSVARMNVYQLAMTPGQDDADFVGPFSKINVDARVRAAETIQNYAGLLLALADPGSGLLVRTEGGKFIASVESLGQRHHLLQPVLHPNFNTRLKRRNPAS